ncbi:uncharacterized protein LOC111252997 [Varroa destructor]|uniref:Uncharacterized protein n=1 Tax=Varroa destructor TaxID=109461 RepID=A0A7M7MD31_VARDE|nr:uncharacterized protein LOC111252997 [Varroa destructor]
MQNLDQFIPKRFGLQLKDYLPNLVGTVLASVIETLIEFGNHLVKWIGPFMSSVEISERSLSNSFIGRFLHWDILDTVLRFTRIPRNCQAKAACEAGAYVLHRNKRVAGFLKAIRAHFSKTSKHWPAAMQGLRGEVCADLYQECARNFIMATPTAGMQKPQGIKNHTVKNDAKK